MSDWTLTKGLQNLRSQVNEVWPNRPKTSDGTIGDAAHMKELSDHNPDDTAGSLAGWNDHDGKREVRAWDCTSAGIPAQEIVDRIRELPNAGRYIRYMIYNRKIYYASNGWKAEAYTGASPHIEHIHFSGQRTEQADNDTSFDYQLWEIVMNEASIADAVWGYKIGDTAWPNRTARQAVADQAAQRDGELGGGAAEGKTPHTIPADSPMGRLLAVPSEVEALSKQVSSLASQVSLLMSKVDQLSK